MSSDSTTVVLERLSIEGALKWAFEERDGIVAGGPEHLAHHVAERTGADETLLYIAIDELIAQGWVKHYPSPDGGAIYRHIKPGEKRVPRKSRLRAPHD